MKQKVFTASEARQRFFEVLKLAEQGEKPLIIKKDSNQMFEVNLAQPKPKRDVRKILEDMSKIDLRSLPPKDIKKVLVSRPDIDKNVSLR